MNDGSFKPLTEQEEHDIVGGVAGTLTGGAKHWYCPAPGAVAEWGTGTATYAGDPYNHSVRAYCVDY